MGERDDVHVTLDDDDARGVSYRVARLEQPVELAALGKDRRLGGIQVLGLAAVEHASAEADDAPARVVDREHDPVAEAVVALAAVALDHESGRLEGRVAVVREHPLECLPLVGRVADAVPGGDGPGEPARLEVVDGTRCVAQRGAVELRRGEEVLGQVGDLLAALALAGALDARHGEPRVARKIVHRVRKRLARVLHQEADRRAVRAATEAVIELLARADGERGRLLAVEGTAGDVVGAGLLERHQAVDDLDDVDARQQRLDEVVGDHRELRDRSITHGRAGGSR